MRYLILLLPFLLMTGCATVSTKTFNPETKERCEAKYSSFFKDMNDVWAELCGGVVGISKTGTSDTIIEGLRVLKEISQDETIDNIKEEIPTDNDSVDDVYDDSPVIDPDPEPGTTTKLNLNYHGKTNEHRHTFYTAEGKLEIGDIVVVNIGDFQTQGTVGVRDNGSTGFDDGRFIIKNSDVPGRYIAVLLPESYNGPLEPAIVSIK